MQPILINHDNGTQSINKQLADLEQQRALTQHHLSLAKKEPTVARSAVRLCIGILMVFLPIWAATNITVLCRAKLKLAGRTSSLQNEFQTPVTTKWPVYPPIDDVSLIDRVSAMGRIRSKVLRTVTGNPKI